MRKYNEQEMLQEFSEFVEVEPVAPSKAIDETVTRMVVKDLSPPPMKVYSKFTLIEAFSGLLTLAICPQFGMGFGQHNEFLHSLHALTAPATFYLLCGVFFVLLGAGVSGMVLNRAEMRTFGNHKYLYFAVYSILAYLVLVMLGPESFVASSLVWILGAFLGNVMGYNAVVRLRRAKF